MSHFPVVRIAALGALALGIWGCATAPTTGANGSGGTANGGNTTTGGAIPCLTKPASGSSTSLECSAAAQVVVVSDSMKQLPNTGTVPMGVGAVQTGKTADATIGIKNGAPTLTAAGLTIESVRLDYQKGSDDEPTDVPALECWNGDGTKRCADVTKEKGWKTVIPSGGAAAAGQSTLEKIKIIYTRYDAKDRTATLVINFGNIGGTDAAKKQATLTIKTVQGKPKLTLAPADGLSWSYVEPGKTDPKKFTMINSGDSVLVINQIKLAEIDPSFSVKLTEPADIDTAEHPGGKPWTLAKPLEIAVGSQAEVQVTFGPKDDKKKGGVIKFDANDSNAPSMPILANSLVPCIALNTTKYQFGGVMPGSQPGEASIKITNCGSVDLNVTSIDFVLGETKSTEFAIDQSGLGPQMSAPPPVSAANPLKLPIKGTAEFKVNYAPSDITPEGAPPDVAVVQVKSNAFVQPKLTLEGVGVKETCPVAVVTVTEGEQVVPQTNIHLIGIKSYAPGGGTIKKYKWTVKQPAGSNQALVPNAALANPTFLANTAGEYQFCLEVWDANDAKSCVPACKDVLVIPNNALHIELLWDTPSDPDQTDSGPAAGADLDLHFAHPLAATLDLDCDTQADPWFSNPWDTFWFNATPEWGTAGVQKDNPTLDLDDTDGAGPENLNLVDPEGTVEEPVQYSVGVHYWNDHGYGTSYATVSIYIQGGLALQFTKVKMDPLDMWYVGRVNWPNTASGGGKKVFETCYQSGLSCPAKKNLMWQPKGDWCMTKCYVNKAFVGSVGGAAAGKCN